MLTYRHVVQRENALISERRPAVHFIAGTNTRRPTNSYQGATRKSLLPLPAFLCSLSIGLMTLWQLLRARPIDFGRAAEVE